MSTKSKSSKGGSNFGYVEQFNYPLSPCYKNQVKAGWHSGGNGSCARKSVESYSTDIESTINGGGYFDWLLGDSEKKKTKTKSKSSAKSGAKSTKSAKSATSTKKKKPSKK